MWLRRDPVVVGGLLVALAALVIGIVLSTGGDESGTVVREEIVGLEDVDDLRAAAGRLVAADGVEVEGVPADEGFWVSADGRRVWVQITTAGESPLVVERGDRVTFTGEVALHEPDFANRREFSAADAEELVEAGAHIEVDVADLRLEG
jgi:hypothetical protein